MLRKDFCCFWHVKVGQNCVPAKKIGVAHETCVWVWYSWVISFSLVHEAVPKFHQSLFLVGHVYEFIHQLLGVLREVAYRDSESQQPPSVALPLFNYSRIISPEP
jgi:hypothetical protein